MTNSAKIRKTFEQNGGIFRLAPNWVPRSFCIPGRRIKLHPDDYYALGIERGAIKERWFSSTITANNGPLAAPDEGMSYVAVSPDSDEKFTLKDCVPQVKFGTLGLMRADQIPDIHAIYVEKEELLPFAYGAKGIGEIATIPTAPALFPREKRAGERR